MHRFNVWSPVLLLMLALLISACQQSGDYADTAADDTPTEETTTAESADDMDTPEAVTVTGTLVDTKCYGMDNANTGNDHGAATGCGAACAGMGIPVALLEGGQAGGTAHVLLISATALAEHMAKEARVTGMPTFQSGLAASKVEVKNDAGEWVDVTPGAMM